MSNPEPGSQWQAVVTQTMTEDGQIHTSVECSGDRIFGAWMLAAGISVLMNTENTERQKEEPEPRIVIPPPGFSAN